MTSTSSDRINGLSTSVAVKAPVKAVSSANLTLSGEQTVGGVALVDGDRVLVKDQDTASENGIYVVSSGAWTRAKDFDGNRDVVQGTLVVTDGVSTALLFYRVTTANPIVIGTSNITFEQASEVQDPYPRTQVEIDAAVTPADYAYASGDSEAANAFRYISQAQVPYIIDGDAANQTAATVTTGLQNGLTAYLNNYIPRGNYKISSALKVKPWSHTHGAGKGYYISALDVAVTGTRLIHSAAAAAITTDYSGDLEDARIGHVVIEDLSLLGGIVSNPLGTYGFYCTSSIQSVCNRVFVSFFTQTGFYYSGSLIAFLNDCEASYCQDCGVFMDYGALEPGETANSYRSSIIGGQFNQNANAGIKLGTSTVKVDIRNVDCESNGNYYPSGLGYGVWISGGSKNVEIQGCWFEGNKIHMVIGATTSPATVPIGTRIIANEFWSTSTGSTKIQLNAGRDTIIESNEFFGGGKIVLGIYAGCPVIRNNYGAFTIEDQNGNAVTNDAAPSTNNFPDPIVSGWTLTNCTVAVEYVASPAGAVPVYKITPSATGAVALQSSNQVWGWAEEFHTFGLYFKTDAAAAVAAYHSVSSVNMPKQYCDSTVDNFLITQDWKWQAVGRSITAADTGNQAFGINFTAVTTDPVYVTGMAAMPGIVHEAWKQPKDTISTLANSATPSVYGMRYALTGGTTTITDLTGGALGQLLTIIAEHSITITDGTNLFLAGSTNFAMSATDTLTVICKADGNWYEVGRSDNT